MSEPLQLTRAEVEASLCRDSFYDFVRTFWEVIIPEKPVWNWHLEYLCEELQIIGQRVFDNKPKEYDLIVNISPGSSKSTIVSVMFPAWCWIKKPSTRLICASYAFALASDLARKSRDVIRSDKFQQYFPAVRIRDDHASVTDFANTKGGDRLSVGVNGAVMGRHGHFLIVDDPLDPNQAHSEAEIKSANHWMIETIPQRKISNLVTPMILIMQRLHHDDPTGAMLERAKKEGAAKIKHICLPADTFERNGGKFKVFPTYLEKNYIDGVMDPTRFPESVLREKEVNLGAYGYAGQYGQNPTPASGGMFKLDYFSQAEKAAPFKARRIFYIDRAATAKETNKSACYTAATLMAKCPLGNYYVEYVLRGQWEPDERNRRIRAACQMFRNRYGPGNEPEVWVEREGGSSGRDAFKSIARALDGFYIREDNVTGDKVTRAEPWSAQLAARNVWMISDGRWDVNAFIEEHLAFPLGKFMDQVDSAASAYNLLANSRIRTNVLRSVQVERRSKKSSVRILVCDESHLEQFDIDKPALLVSFQDPQNGRSTGDAQLLLENKNNVAKVVDSLALHYAPIDLESTHEIWGVPLPDYGLPAEDLVMDASLGKRLWGFLTRSRTEPCSIIVLVDSGDGRAQSTALALADSMRIDRAEIESTETLDTEPRIPHVYKMTKHTRSMVIT